MKLLTNIRARAKDGDRSGTVLVLFAVLVFAVLAIAALTVDVGFASLAQSQMQTAVDTASMEGVRLRDFYEYRSLSERYRRPRVSELVQQVFDDDLHPTGGVPNSGEGPPALSPDDPDQLRLGAGPVLHVTGGVGDANASALLEVPDYGGLVGPDHYVDDPRLEINRRNDRGGDMVTGSFVPNASHAESSDYARDDFVVAAPGSVDNAVYNALSFLVRMRRTTGENSADQQPLVSSRGPTLPFVFGLGSTMHAADNGYDPRRDGLAVRATAIASARPALSIGPPPLADDGTRLPGRIATEPIYGVGYWYQPASGARKHYSVALDLQSFWISRASTSDSETNWSMVFDDHGGLYLESAPTVQVGQLMPGGTMVGRLVPSDLRNDDPRIDGDGIPGPTVIDVFHAIGAQTSTTTYSRYGYFPVYDRITSPSAAALPRIVGFGYGRLEQVTNPDTGAQRLAFTLDFAQRDSAGVPKMLVAPDNACASLGRAGLDRMQAIDPLTQSEWDQVFGRTNQFAFLTGVPSYRWQDVRPGTLLAPALTR